MFYCFGVLNIMIPLIVSSRKTDAAAYGILAIVIKSTVVILSMNEITVTGFFVSPYAYPRALQILPRMSALTLAFGRNCEYTVLSDVPLIVS